MIIVFYKCYIIIYMYFFLQLLWFGKSFFYFVMVNTPFIGHVSLNIFVFINLWTVLISFNVHSTLLQVWRSQHLIHYQCWLWLFLMPSLFCCKEPLQILEGVFYFICYTVSYSLFHCYYYFHTPSCCIYVHISLFVFSSFNKWYKLEIVFTYALIKKPSGVACLE